MTDTSLHMSLPDGAPGRSADRPFSARKLALVRSRREARSRGTVIDSDVPAQLLAAAQEQS